MLGLHDTAALMFNTRVCNDFSAPLVSGRLPQKAMLDIADITVGSHNGTLSIDTESKGITSPWDVKRAIDSLLKDKSVLHITAIVIQPHDLTLIVNIKGNRTVCPRKRHIDGGERAILIKEPTSFPVGFHINSDDLAIVIDAERLRVQSARK